MKIREFKRKIKLILEKKEKDVKAFKSPIALFNWAVGQWYRPLRPAEVKWAYMASWELAFDHGLVEL